MRLRAALPIGALFLSSCSSLTDWASRNAEHREFQVRKVWVRPAPAEKNNAYRKINRMPPLMTGPMLLIGNAIDGLSAWDRDTGQLLWRKKTVNGVEGGAALIKDRLFFGGSDGFFYSVDVRSGATIWSTPTRAEALGEPLIDADNGRVFVLTSNNVLHAFESDSGKVLWVYSRPDASAFSIRGGTKPALSKDSVFVGTSDGAVVALDAKTGAIRWENTLNKNKRFRDIDTNPVVDGDRLYVAGYDDKLYCLSADKGEVLWRLDGGGYAAVTLDGNRLYFPTTAGELIALNRDGQKLWTYKLEKGIGTSAVKMKGLILFGESQGDLVFLEPTTGKKVGSFEPGRGLMSTPLVDEKRNRVYFISGEANVYALEAGWNVAPGIPYLR